MERPTIITISGSPGAGKSSTADRVAEMLGYTRYSSGDLVRKVVQKRNLTLAEYNERAAEDHSLDEAVDDELRKLRNYHDIIIDSRLGFYWIPESFKVFLDLDIEVASVRIFKDAVNNEARSGVGEFSDSLKAATDRVRERMETERQRFKNLYNVDPFNRSHFDLTVDTSRHSPETVALTIFDHYRQWLKTDAWKPVHSSVPLGYSMKNQY